MTDTALAMTTEDIASLVPWKPNPRRGKVSAIAESLKTNGQYKPVIVQASTRKILAGNHVVKAALRLGWTTVQCAIVDVDDETAKRIVLADNRTSELGSFDETDLAAMLKSLDDLTGTGYDLDDVTKLDLKLTVEDERPEVEFSAKVFEESNYVVLVFDNSLDWLAAKETLGLKPVKTWDSRPGYKRDGLGRVIKGAPVIARLNRASH